MPIQLTYEVPRSAQRSAERALALHREAPLSDVYGVAIAEALTSGRVGLEIAAKMRRFFAVNGRQYEAAAQLQHSELESPLMRGWLLHGAEAGRAWAESVCGRAIREGYAPKDATTDLLSAEPEEIYAAFSLGAWRWEYALDPRKAARFVEEYHSASGWNLELRRAFGDSAEAVGRALWRRFHPVDPFKDAARCLDVRDTAYQLAAQADLTELVDSNGALEEGLKPGAFTAPTATMSKMVWPGFVAYVVLACERPDLLVEVNKASQKPPPIGMTPKGFAAYTDAIWTAITFFHPLGSRYVNPKEGDEDTAKAFGSLSDEIFDMMTRAYYGKHIQGVQARKLLGKARRWTAQNKLAGSLFHVFNADWAKGNWQHILDNIPEDHDVRPAFAEFVKENPLPLEGVKLQQTLSDKATKKEVVGFLWSKKLVAIDDLDKLEQVKIGSLYAADVCAEMGTPIGVYSVLEFQGESWMLLGDFITNAGDRLVLRNLKTNALEVAMPGNLASSLKSGMTKVLLAHADMPGSAYGAKTKPKAPVHDQGTDVPPDPAPEPEETPEPSKAEPAVLVVSKWSEADLALLKTGVDNSKPYTKDLGKAIEIKLADTAFGAAAKIKTGVTVRVGQVWMNKGTKSHTLVSAVRFPFKYQGGDQVRLLVEWSDGVRAIVGDAYAAERVKQGILTYVDPKTAPAVPVTSMIHPDIKVELTAVFGDFVNAPWTTALLSETKFAAVLKTVLGLTAHELPTLQLQKSAFATAVGVLDGGTCVPFLAVQRPSSLSSGNTVVIVFKLANANFFVCGDELAANAIKIASLTIPVSTTAPVAVPEPPKSIVDDDPFAFHPGEIVKWSGAAWLVLSDVVSNGTPSSDFYYAARLRASGLVGPTATTKLLRTTLETEGSLLSKLSGNYVSLDVVPHVVYPVYATPSPLVTPLTIGSQIVADGETWMVGGFAVNIDSKKEQYALLMAPATVEIGSLILKGLKLLVRPLSELVSQTVTPSYAPTDLAPESSHEADEPDAEQGNPAMSGTSSAFAWLANKGWTPAVQSENAAFIFPLGGRQFYDTEGKKRTVLGYGFSKPNEPVYVIRTETGTINWVSCANAHKKYGPLDVMDSQVVKALLPKPGTAPAKFPKLNYKLSELAKNVSAATGLVFQPAPPDAPFKSGTPLLSLGVKNVRLLGWTINEQGQRAVLIVDGAPESSFYLVGAETLAASYTLRYEQKTLVSASDGVVFGKGAGNQKLQASNYVTGLMLPSSLAVGWDTVPPVSQPQFDAIPSGKHVSAGIVVLVPPMSVTDGTATATIGVASVVLYHPLGGYGGYKLCIPKGTVEKGESLTLAAVREVKEETGLSVKPVAFLGDFHANNSVTRLFIGYATGGNPSAVNDSEECDAVMFAPLDAGYLDSSWFKKLLPASGNTWQQEAIKAAFAWCDKHGYPGNYQPNTETTDAQVTLSGDTEKWQQAMGAAEKTKQQVSVLAAVASMLGEPPTPTHYMTPAKSAEEVPSTNPVGWAPNIPASEVNKANVWKTLLFQAPFPISGHMLDSLKAKAKVNNAQPVSFDIARERELGPKYGQAFETKAGSPLVSAGFVSWLDTKNIVRRYLIATSASGVVEILETTDGGYTDGKIASDQTLANAPHDAWFTHPVALTNLVIRKIYEQGGLKGAANITEFKGWMKTAGVPAWAVISTNLVRDLAAMFVPGACSQAQFDALVGCLKARMKSTHADKPVASAPVGSMMTGTMPPLVTPTVVLSTGPLSPVLKQYVNTPQPHLFSLADKSPQTITPGTKPSMLLNGPGGKQWFAKYAHGEAWRPRVDRAAYQLCELVKSNNVPVGVMEFDGKTVSYQPFASNAKSPPSDPNELDDQNKAELLSQHAADMFMGDHDGNVTNWIQVDGRIIAVDRGQAFKFLMQGQAESLDPTWHAPGNFGAGYAKALLIAWGKGEAEIPQMAWASMLKTVRAVKDITLPQLQSVLTPVFDSMNTAPEKRQSVTVALRSRAESYEKDWTTTLKKLRKSFAWPALSISAPPSKVFTSSPKDLGFGKREEKVIAEAVAAKWAGKTLKIGGLAMENQEVMVKRVLWEEKPGLKVAATLLHFRVARPAGVAAAKNLYKFGGLEISETPGSGPQRLKVDHQGNYWEKIFAAIKTLNHHLAIQKDGKPNMQTIGSATSLRPQFEMLAKNAVNPSGSYAGTNESNEAVYAMAEQYLQYLSIIEWRVAHKDELIGQHSPQLYEFVWEPPPPATAVPASSVAPAYKVSVKKQGALWPTATPVGQEVHVTNLNKPVINSAMQSQFVIEDPLTKARIFWCPPGGLTSNGMEMLKDGVESLKGQGWAIMSGEPSPAIVAHLLKLFQDATGLSMQAASDADAEVLYWSRQANILQSNGQLKPKADHTTVVEGPYASALATYEKGDAKSAVAQLKSVVAWKLGKSVAQIEEFVTSNEIEGTYAKGAGFAHIHRIGWTRARLQKEMGPDCRLAHNLLNSTLIESLKLLASNGALLANAIKPYYGVMKMGASPDADMAVGGGQGIFMCFRKGFSPTDGMLYFDISLALRVDVYIVGTDDTYGNTSKERYTTPEQWIEMGANKATGKTSASSPQQVNVRHDVDLQQYLVAAFCADESARQQCIQLANGLGWTFFGGAKPETVFRVK